VVRLLAYVSGSVNQELLLRNEYLAAENRILRAKLPTRLRLGIRSAPLSPRSECVRDVEGFVRSPASRNPTRSWAGIDGSLPRSSTAPNTDSIPAVLQFQRKLKPWWSGWRERTPAGDMTESLAPWPTWVITCPIRRWGTYSVAMVSLRLLSEAKSRHGRTFSPLT